MRRGIVAGTLVALLVLAAPAPAVDRYAVPSGGFPSGNCTALTACTLTYAVESAAQPNDTVHLAPGTFFLDAEVDVLDNGVTLAGPATGPRAHVWSTGVVALRVFPELVTLRDLDVTATNAGSSSPVIQQQPLGFSMKIDRVRVTGLGSTAFGLTIRGGAGTVVSNSLVTTEAAGGVAVLGAGAGGALVNVTARARSAGGRALSANKSLMVGGETQTVHVVNSILDGAFRDVEADGDGTRQVNVTLDHVNASTFTVSPVGAAVAQTAVQAAEPALAADGVTQLSSSPTLDAGVSDPRQGVADLFGGTRVLGSAIDIGAHESERPPAPPDPPPPPTQPQTQAPSTTPPPPGVTRPPVSTPLTLSAVRLTKSRFRAGAKGVKLQWTLGRGATVTATVLRRARGVRRGRRCGPGRGRRTCSYEEAVGKPIRRVSTRTTDSVAFSGKGLRPGRYVLSVVASAGREKTAARRVTFTISRR